MLRLQPLFGVLIVIALAGCRQDTDGTDIPADTDNLSEEESNAQWEELEEDGSDGSEGGKDGTAGDTGKSRLLRVPPTERWILLRTGCR